MSSYLDYVLSTLVEIDSQIQKPYSAGSVPQVSDLVDKISQKLSMEFSNSLAQRDERFTHLEMQAEKMTQDSSYLINQWEEKEKKIQTSINHLMQKTDNLSSIVTNQVNEQTKNTDSLKLKICDLDSQTDKNNCQFSSIACEINGLRESCDRHGYQLINLQRQIKNLGDQKLLSESLTTRLESSEQPDAESNLQAEARLKNTKSSPAAAAPLHSSLTPLPEKEKILQDPDHVMKSKANSSTVLKDSRTSSEEQNKEKAGIDNNFNTTKQPQPEIFKGNHGNQESCKTLTDKLKLPEESSSVTDTQKPQPTQGYSIYPAMYYHNGWPNLEILQATAPIRSLPRERRIISITDPESGHNITDEIINRRQNFVDSEEHNEEMPAVNPSNQEICKIFTRLVADRFKPPEETNSVTDTQSGAVGASSASMQSSRYQQRPPQQVQQANPAHAAATLIRPMSHMMRPDLTQPPPQIRQSTPALLYIPKQNPTLHGPRMNQLQQALRPQMPQIIGVQQTAPVVPHQVPLVSQTPSAPHVPQPFSSGQVADFVPLAAKLEASAPNVDKVNPTTEATPQDIPTENVASAPKYAPRYPVNQPQPTQRFSTYPAMYYNNGWPNPGIPQATAPIRPPQAGEKRIISITDPESGHNVTDEITTEEQSEGSEKCSGILPIKTLLAEGKTNISSDVTSQISETKARSLKKAMKSQASHRSGLTNHVDKKSCLTFDNDKSKLVELRFCFKALKKPTCLPDLEIVLDEPNIGPQQLKRKTKPEFPESFFEQPSERWMGKKNTEAVIGNDRKA